MALIDENYLKDTFNIHKDVKSGRMTPAIARAARRLEAWVGSTTYASTEVVTILKLAEGTLAMAFLIRNLNTGIRSNGLVLTEQVEGNVTITYQNPAQTAQTEQAYFEDAQNIVRDLIEASDLPPAPEFVETDIDFQDDPEYPKWPT